MRIINLVENETGSSGCEAAHGLSFYVETEKHKLLFDVGPTKAILRNAQKLGINLTAVDTVILSHGHYDHSGGMLPFARLNPAARIYMQHNADGEFYSVNTADGQMADSNTSVGGGTGEETSYRYIGIDKKILSLPQVQLLRGDTKLDDELQLFTVDVERRAFPLPSTNARLKRLSAGQYLQDDFSHEQNLLLTTCGKKILFCGCAHNGILNVLDALERKLGTGALPDLVLGGFHLMNRHGTPAAATAAVSAPSVTPSTAELTAEIREIAERLKKYKAHFATCHCTGLAAFNQMKEIMGDKLSYVYSGDEVEV